ncbi:sensor histidine kinase [Azospirillum palustre]
MPSTDAVPGMSGGAAPAPLSRPAWAWRSALCLAILIPVLTALAFIVNPTLSDDAAALFIGEALLTVPGDWAGDRAAGPEAWSPVSLPYRCPTTTAAEGCAVTFRIGYRYDPAARPADQGVVSFYAPSFQGVLTVSLNGVFLATSAWSRAEADVSGNVPFLVTVPGLHPGLNEFEIALSKRGVISAFLDRVAIGPDALLRPDHDRRRFLFATLQRMLDGWHITMGLSLFIIWLACRREQVFLVTSGVILSHAAVSLPAILGDGMLSETSLQLINHTRFLTTSLILPMALLFVHRPLPVPLGVFLLPPFMVAVSFLTLPVDLHRWLLTTVYFPLMCVAALWVLFVVVRVAVRERDIAATALAGAFLFNLVIAVHDILLTRDSLGESRVLLGRFAWPVIMAVVSAVLIWRFAQTMNVLDQFSQRLKSEVAAAERALRRSFAREQQQAKAAVLEAERVRLMSDLHDGIAGQLVSILALCELRGESSGEVAVSVGGALADLRLVVASLENSGDDLGVMLALFRERIEPQLMAQGMTLIWRASALPEVKGLHPGATLNIFRILQEASVNAARHSGSSTLTIEGGPSPRPGHGVRLCLRDQGHGGVAARPGSYGLGNMRRRADALGGTLDIQSDPGGTAVTLDLPAEIPGPAAA